MEKRVLALAAIFMFAIVLSGAVLAASADYADEINNAIDCLDRRVGNTTISFEEAIFSALAEVPNSKVNKTISNAKSSSEFCWPKSGCNVKDTAQAALAKSAMGENIGNITKWLETQSGVTAGLTWYLQISADSNSPASCVVNYDSTDHTVNINDEMKLEGSPGSCFTIAHSNYWLKIKDSCLEEEFNIKCNESFKTNLLYEKSTGGTVYVSADTHGAAGDAWTLEIIDARCFKEGGVCNYEASLWAAMALYANGDSLDEYAPYLRAMASSNEKYFPSAFLVAILQGGDDYYSKIIESEKVRPDGAYWEIPNTAYNKFYDTSLAMLALGGADSSEIENANTLNYLFEEQDESGCWNSNSIRDTAFVIYAAGWQRDETTDSGEEPPGSDDNESDGDGDYNPALETDCELSGYYCASSIYACTEAGGIYLPQETHPCTSYIEYCCTVDVPEENCAALGGSICAYDETCSGQIKQSSEGSCCLDTCESSTGECLSDSDCISGKVCVAGECVYGDQSECTANADCDSGEQCQNGSCVAKSGSSFWIWIIVLIILIALVVLGIIYRDKLRVWWFKFRGKAKTSKILPPRAPPGAGAIGRRPTPTFIPVRRPMQPIRRAPPRKPERNEEDETFKKLREMGG